MKTKVVFWDFDGVLMDSNPVRDLGFKEVLKDYPLDEVEQLMIFHQANGGLSRYVKFRYFFEKIRGESLSDEQLLIWADRFSQIMKQLLLDPKLLIEESIDFVKNNYNQFAMHIVSGSDGNELRYLCNQLDISKYFISIHGSPTPKKQLVGDLLKKHQYSIDNCILIGDSINDYEAAQENKLNFFGYRNEKLKELSLNYIENLKLECLDI